jgi:hypothetical protein
MVNGVPLGQMPAKQVLRHEYVLEDIRPTGGSRMAWNAHHHVPGLVLGTATLPISVRLSLDIPAATASLRRCRTTPAVHGQFAGVLENSSACFAGLYVTR